MNKVYLIKSLSPWMLDELIAFSQHTDFKVIFLRKPSPFYNDGFEKLKKNKIEILSKPFKNNFIFKKTFFVFRFLIANLNNFFGGYSAVIGLKSLFWFLKLDMSLFVENTSIHAQFATQASVIAFMLKKFYKKGIEYSFTFHAYDIFFSNKWFSLLVNESIKSFSISEYNVKYVKEKYPKSYHEKIAICRLGVFKPYLLMPKNNNNEFLTLGLMSRFVEKKGIIYLLETIKKIRFENKIKIKLLLAGEGPLKQIILNFIESNHLHGNITYLGQIKGDEKREFFKSIDIFVLPAIIVPNDQDGIPVVLMEAISYGIPIISTHISGIPEICIDNYNGYLVPECDTVSLINALYKITNNFELIDKFSKNSLILAKNYDIIKNSYQKLFKLEWI